MYGYHPEEPLAEEIGENLAKRDIPGIEAIMFRPTCITDDYKKLNDKEQEALTLEGKRELKKYLREAYEFSFVLDLHETPWRVEKNYPRFAVFYPGWNRRFENVLEQFEKEYSEKVWTLGASPKGFPTYHSAVIEYYSKIGRDGYILTLNKDTGEKFAIDLIDCLKRNYLKSGELEVI